MHFDSFQNNVRINNISQFCGPVVQIFKNRFHVTIRLAVGHFLWVVHCDHVFYFAPFGRYEASNVTRMPIKGSPPKYK